MKKSIISVILLISLSTQSTFPLLESVRKKISKTAVSAKELLNLKGNFRCMRKGDNCSKEKRKMLLTISALLATLAALGVAAAGVAIASKVNGISLETKHARVQIFNQAKDHMWKWEFFEDIKKLAEQQGVALKDVGHNGSGYSLIGAVIMSPVVQKTKDGIYALQFKKVIEELLGAGVEPTPLDKKLITDKDLKIWLLDEQAKYK